MSRKHNRYLVGYDDDFYPVRDNSVEAFQGWAKPMTLEEAKEWIKKFTPNKGAKIFKLVPIKQGMHFRKSEGRLR